MPEKRSGPVARFVFCAVLATTLVQSVSGQVAAPPPANPALPSSTAALEQTPKPRPPTQQDVAQLKAEEDIPGSILISVAIVGDFAYAWFMPHGANESASMLATKISGKWTFITNDASNADEMVQYLPSMPLPVAQVLVKQAERDEVYWTGNAHGDEWAKKAQAYFDYVEQGDTAAGKGDFDEAIAAWKKAAAIDLGDAKSCGDLAQRLDIRAATDAKARMYELHLTKKAAASWFQRRDVEVWNTHRGCEVP